MAFNSFSLLEDIVDDTPQTVVSFNQKAKETAQKQAQELQQKQAQQLQRPPSYSSPPQKNNYKMSIKKRDKFIEESLRFFQKEKQYIEGWKRWLEVEKELLLNKDESAYFSSRYKEGQEKGLLDQQRRILEAERRNKEQERLFLEKWTWLVEEEKSYIEGWKIWVDEEEKKRNMGGDRSWIKGRESEIREEEQMYVEASWRWIKEEKVFIEENRRWVVEEESRITLEKEKLEKEKNAPFASLSKKNQTYILKQRRNMVNERKLINVEEKVVSEAEKWIKEEEKRIKEEEKQIYATTKVIKKENHESWALISKEEKAKIWKHALFSHPKIERTPPRQNIPERKSQNFDQNIPKGKANNSEQSIVKGTEETQSEVVAIEEVKDESETKSETSEGKRNKKKKKLQKKIIVKPKEEEDAERRKEVEVMKKMKTLKEYEEDLIKKKEKLGVKMKIVGEIRKVDHAEEFKSMKIIGKKKEIINGFLSNGIKNNLSNGHKETS